MSAAQPDPVDTLMLQAAKAAGALLGAADIGAARRGSLCATWKEKHEQGSQGHDAGLDQRRHAAVLWRRPARRRSRRGLLSRFWIGLQIAVLRMQIWSTEDWLADCARDGLHESLALTEFRADLERMRCRVAYLESL